MTLDLPYAVKATRVVWMIQHQPPPTPLCFDSKAQWQSYLMYLDASGERITRRQDTGKWAADHHGGRRIVVTVFDRIDHCQDCQIGGSRQLRMQREARCLIPPTITPPSKD